MLQIEYMAKLSKNNVVESLKKLYGMNGEEIKIIQPDDDYKNLRDAIDSIIKQSQELGLEKVV